MSLYYLYMKFYITPATHLQGSDFTPFITFLLGPTSFFGGWQHSDTDSTDTAPAGSGASTAKVAVWKATGEAPKWVPPRPHRLIYFLNVRLEVLGSKVRIQDNCVITPMYPIYRYRL